MEKLSGTPNSKPEGEKASISSSSSPPAPDNTRSADSAQAPSKKIQISKAVPSKVADTSNPFTKMGAQARAASLTSAPSTVRTPDTAASTSKRKRAELDSQTSPRPPRTSTTPAADEPIEQWENRTLSTIFRFTLDPQQKTDGSHKLILLSNLRQELIDEEAPILLTKDRLDSALLEAGSTIQHNKSILDYLLPCWKRVVKASKGLRGYAGAKDAILKEAKRLCMSYCIFAVEMPELYGSVMPIFLKVLDELLS